MRVQAALDAPLRVGDEFKCGYRGLRMSRPRGKALPTNHLLHITNATLADKAICRPCQLLILSRPACSQRSKLNPRNEGKELKGQDTGDSFKFCDSASRKFAFLREIRTGADLTLKGGALKVGRS